MNHIKDHRGTYTVVVNNQSYTFDVEHPHYMGLVECVKSGDVEEFKGDRVVPSFTIAKSYYVKYEDGVIYDETIAKKGNPDESH